MAGHLQPLVPRQRSPQLLGQREDLTRERRGHGLRVRDYAAYDPPLWERLLAALHDRGGAYFDADETQRARGWTQTPEGARVAAEYVDTDPARERSCVPRSRLPSAT